MTLINKIAFQADGSPYSEQFNDIYFDTESGYQQSEHVFINGNKIAQRIIETEQEFVIGETGFGTGLNFLLTLKLCNKLAINNELTTVHFISTEKYPLSKEQLLKSFECLPEIRKEAQLLLDRYPETPSEKIECSFLNGKVTLTILLNDSTKALESIKLGRKSEGLVDAWYLDGFSPAKNPEMWTTDLFSQIARLSKPQSTFSTFTVAGFIRRGLDEVGFRLEKKQYQGKKKEILTGVYQQNRTNGKGYQLRPNINKPQHVAVIGGGIASACIAYALTKAGIKVTVYCKDDEVAQGASSNDIGALFPLLHQQVDEISAFYQQAFWHALGWYKSLLKQGFYFDHEWCGLLEISYKEALKKRQAMFEKNTPWPRELIHSVNVEQASKLSGLNLEHGGLFMPEAGWIAPKELVQQLFQAAKQTNRLKIKTNVIVKSTVQDENDNWLLKTNKSEYKASILVYCGGAEAINLPVVSQLPLSSVRGQVTSVTSKGEVSKLNTVICHKGYLTPQNNNSHCIGATFEKESFDVEAREADDKYNLTMLETCLPGLTQWNLSDVTSSKARLRCTTPDHLPVVGAMPDTEEHKVIYSHLRKDKNWRYNEPAPVINNLYVLTGLGARGLCSAPLLADILAADLSGTPYPVDNEMLFNLSPNRFVIRDLIKRKV